MRKTAISMIVMAAVIEIFGVGETRAQSAESIWDGVYSEAQAVRGSKQYFQHCSVCHAANLRGTYETPPLVGRFMPDWAGSTLDDLYQYISSAMPLDHPDSLSPANYADIIAFLLKQNGLPAGKSALQPGNGLKTITFDIVRPPAPTQPSNPRKTKK